MLVFPNYAKKCASIFGWVDLVGWVSMVLFVWVWLCRVGLGEVGLGRIGWFVRAARVHLVCMVYLLGLVRSG